MNHAWSSERPARGSRPAITGPLEASGRRLTEPPMVRAALVVVATSFLGLFLGVPLVAVCVEALRDGAGAYLQAVTDPDAVAALQLTLLVVAIAVPANLAFGLAAAWTVTRYRFRGKALLLTLIDLPFAVSPVVAGFLFVLLFGRQGVFGDWFGSTGIPILFAVPGIVLATIFVSSPFIAREVIPVLEAAGTHEEEAARVLGAAGWQVFRRVTWPNIQWGVAYGVILCSARVVGEFGAVSVVSGRVRGLTNTLPLHVEIVYNEYRFQAAFAVASILTALAVLSLVMRSIAERRLS